MEKINAKLLEASEKGNIDDVTLMLEVGADIETFNNGGSTPLIMASIYENKEIVEFLIENGGDINAKNVIGTTPLSGALDMGYTEISEILKKAIKDKEEKEYKRVNKMRKLDAKLLEASEKGNINDVTLLLEVCADIEIKNEMGNTPLILASRSDHEEIVEFLIEKGANVNAKNRCGSTPLGGASVYGNTDIVQILIDNGADVNAKNNEGITPLMLASFNGHEKILIILITNGADVHTKSYGEIPFSYYAYRNNTKEIIEVPNDEYVIAKDNCGITALGVASEYGYGKIVKILIEKDADVYAEDCFGETPLSSALSYISYNHRDVVKILKKAIKEKEDKRVNKRRKVDEESDELIVKKQKINIIRI